VSTIPTGWHADQDESETLRQIKMKATPGGTY
jgi:hypothetical protein